MSEDMKNFCIKYKEKLKNDKDIKENKKDWLDDYRDRISFKLSVRRSHPHISFIRGSSDEPLFILDSEDLEYLYNKYSKKVVEELEQNIKELKQDYTVLFNYENRHGIIH